MSSKGPLSLSSLRDTRAALSDLLNWGKIIDPGVVLNKDGSFMTGFSFSGPDLESASGEELSAVSARINAAFLTLGSGWMVHIDLVRMPIHVYLPDGGFPDAATRAIDTERKLQFESEGAHWVSKRIVTLTWLPPAETGSRIAGFFTDSKGYEYEKTRRWADLARFGQDVDRFQDRLSGALSLTRLSDDELLTHLHTCLTGKNHPVRRFTGYLDGLLASGDLVGGLDPRIGRNFFRVVSVTGFPAMTTPGLLDILGHVPFPYRFSIRFIPMDPVHAERELARFRKRWLQLRMGLMGLFSGKDSESGAGSSALSQGMDVEQAQAENADGSVRFGFVQFKLILFDDNQATLARHVREMEKLVNNLGFPTFPEEMNNLSAWIESLPGHSYPNIRRPILHSLNVADLMPVTTIWSGRERNPCPFYPEGSPALFMASGSGATPFFGNIHVGDLGHTLILGPPGSGKSALLSFLAAQFFRYPRAQVFAFDKGASIYVLSRALKGRFYEIAGPSSEISFCPLAGVDDPAEAVWAQGWVESMVSLQGVTLTPGIKSEISNALKLHARTPPPRTMGLFVERIQDHVTKEALRYYTRSGSMGVLLDADSDGLSESRMSVFEMEHAFSLTESALLPLLLYLFHRIENRLDGRPTLILLDEVWLFLSHPVFREKIREWLKTLRKKNAAVVFATQQPFDVVNSPIRDVILESCPTKITLANPEALSGPSRLAYEAMGLSPRSIEIVAGMTPKRQYYVTSPEGKRLVDLSLGRVALAFCGVSDRDELRAASALEDEHFAPRWLLHKKIPDWARYVEELERDL